MTTGTAQVWTLNPMNTLLTVSLRARRDTTQVMLGVCFPMLPTGCRNVPLIWGTQGYSAHVPGKGG